MGDMHGSMWAKLKGIISHSHTAAMFQANGLFIETKSLREWA